MNKKAFTLVELIVVITILAILGTIAFISFQGYTKSARDSVRISDLKNIEKSLSLYKIKTGEYPEPSDPYQVEYDDKEVWTQGTIGQSVITNLDKLNKVPRDPLTGSEYTYSRLNTKKELQLACILEGSPVAFIKNEEIKNKNYKNLYTSIPVGETGEKQEITETLFSVIPAEAGIYKNNFIPQANAAEAKTTATAYVIGDYNGQIAKVNSGSTTYVLAVPSIINGDMTLTDIIELISNKKLVYTGYGNLPSSYTGTIFEMNGGFDYSQTGGIVVYSGSINDIKSNEEAGLRLINNLQEVYSGTILENTGNIKKLLETDVNLDTPTDEAKILACGTMDFGLNTELMIDGCGGVLSGSGSSGGETNTYSNCSSVGDKLTAATTFPGCDTEDIIICSGSGTGYTISACNVGATIASTDWTVSRGQYFQWGRNKGFNYNDSSQQATTIDGSIGLNAGTDTYGFVWSPTLPGWNSWANTDIINNWGDTSDTYESRQGPCDSGYHVPSQEEWGGIISAGDGYLWDIAGTSTEGTDMQTILKLPYSGIRLWPNGILRSGGDSGYYWSSSSNGSLGYRLFFYSSYINSSTSYPYAGGFSVRCFKN